MANPESSDLMTQLRAGAEILMDGAMGTELERRGVSFEGDGWSALAVRDHGAVIRDIHRDYLDTGARLHIVNSFALARHVLEPLGFGDDFEKFNRQVVADFDAAVEASGHLRKTLWAAGSLSTFAAFSDRSLLPTGAALVANYRDQAQILHDAGVDLFAFEMLFDADVSLAMWAAVENLDLPAIFGFTCDWADDSRRQVTSLHGMGKPVSPLDEVLRAVIDRIDPDRAIFSIMHSELDVTDAALEILQHHWDGPIAIYPNSGDFVDLHLQFDSVCPADDFARAARRWRQAGVQVIGGCCGIGPPHIDALAATASRD